MYHDLFSFTKTGEHFVSSFGLDFWFAFRTKEEQNRRHNSDIFVGSKYELLSWRSRTY